MTEAGQEGLEGPATRSVYDVRSRSGCEKRGFRSMGIRWVDTRKRKFSRDVCADVTVEKHTCEMFTLTLPLVVSKCLVSACASHARRKQIQIHTVSARGAMKLPHTDSKLAIQILWNVETDWTRRRMGVHIDRCQGGSHRTCSFIWAGIFWIMSHSKMHLRQMMM